MTPLNLNMTPPSRIPPRNFLRLDADLIYNGWFTSGLNFNKNKIGRVRQPRRRVNDQPVQRPVLELFGRLSEI